MLNVKFNLVFGILLAILSLLCLIVSKLSISSLHQYLNTIGDINNIFKEQIINEIFFHLQDNEAENNFMIDNIIIGYNIKYTNYNYLTPNYTNNGECYDSIGNKPNVNCLNTLYDIVNSEYQIRINNKNIPISISNKTSPYLKANYMNVTLYKNNTETTHILSTMIFNTLPGINEDCISNKIVSSHMFSTLYDNINDYEQNRSKTNLLPLIILSLSLAYLIQIVLINKHETNILKKTGMVTVMLFALLVYIYLIIMISIYLKTYFIAFIIKNKLSNNCFDEELNNYLFPIISSAVSINNYSLLILVINFGIATILSYKIKILILLNLQERKEIKIELIFKDKLNSTI
jgi:hypothetical protein